MTRTLRFAARRLLRARVFTATAVLTLALGIGGASAVFSVVNGVLLSPLPFPNAARLVDLSHTLDVSGPLRVDQSDATYLVYRRENRTFTDIGAFRSIAVNLGGLEGSGSAEPPEHVSAAVATEGLFDVLGVEPVAGRSLDDEDSRPGAPPVVVISQRIWERSFGSDAAIVGKRVMVDGEERAIVGVAPASFRFPDFGTAVWLPLALDPSHTKSAAFDYRVVGRLREGVTPAAAERDLARLLPRVPEVYPGRLTAPAIQNTHMRPIVRPLRDVAVGDVGRVLWVVLGAVAVLLLIACANVANLFLARSEGRQRELAVRRALGGGQVAMLLDVLSEATIVAALGGVLGLALASWGIDVLQSIGAGASIPRVMEVHISGAVLAMTAGATTLAAVLVSVGPVLRAGRTSLSAMLMANAQSASGRARHRIRRLLVVAQVALALILVTSASLLARSFARLRSVDPGFVADHGLAVRMTLPISTYPTTAAAARAIYRARDAIAALPGVDVAAVTTKLPLDAEGRQDSVVYIEDQPVRAGSIPRLHQIVFVTPGYFGAMGIPMVAGRDFGTLDADGAPSSGPPEVIVSAAFAHRYWSNESALGKRVRMNPGDPWHTIVGVVGSVRDVTLEDPPTEAVYAPLVTLSAAGTPWVPRDIVVVVRATGDPAALAPPVRRAMQVVDADLPLYRVIPTTTLLSDAAARTTFTLLVLGVAAIVAMTIGAIGIYGVISYLVSLRSREIGVRLALGAAPADMRRLVTRQALADASVGVGFGIVGALIVTRVLGAVLFDVSPTDPIALAAGAVLLLTTAWAASWAPARRAAGLDPASTLRSD